MGENTPYVMVVASWLGLATTPYKNVLYFTQFEGVYNLHLEQVSFYDVKQACVIGLSAWTTLWNCVIL
jgi:hypothetical protein